MKAGLDMDHVVTTGRVAFSGLAVYREDRRARYWQVHRSMGYMLGPDQPKLVPLWNTASSSNGLGAFVQDSWNVLDKVSLNVGLRYDMQTLYGGDGRLAVALPNQLSPRVGVVYDFTQQGRGKLFANYARYYQNTAMEMVNAQFPGERRLQSFYRSPRGTQPGCDPLHQVAPYDECRDPNNLQTLFDRGYSNEQDPNAKWLPIRGDNVPVDPQLKPQSSDEFVVGGEYQLLDDARAGVTYTRRYMNAVIEDMSNDQATTFFIGNPGEGIASAFPTAVRDYDAVTAFLDKRFANQWLGQVSYTWSSLRGNYTGMFRPESGQLAPNITSDFDLASLLQNRLGPLPSDRTHSIKAYAAREFILPGKVVANLGLTYRGHSGTPLSVLGSHDLYGDGQVYILERGAAGRMPWVHDFDARLGLSYPVTQGVVASLSADVFNLFNFQQAVSRDQNYTLDVVEPLVGSRDLADLETLDVKRNPNYGHTTAYQAPRSVRISAKLSF
jgi:outer membrane receptor protein involved in Fe transport